MIYSIDSSLRWSETTRHRTEYRALGYHLHETHLSALLRWKPGIRVRFHCHEVELRRDEIGLDNEW